MLLGVTEIWCNLLVQLPPAQHDGETPINEPMSVCLLFCYKWSPWGWLLEPHCLVSSGEMTLPVSVCKSLSQTPEVTHRLHGDRAVTVAVGAHVTRPALTVPRCWATSVLSHSFSPRLNPSWEASRSVINNFLKQPYPATGTSDTCDSPLEVTCRTLKSWRGLGVARKCTLINFTRTFFTYLCILTFPSNSFICLKFILVHNIKQEFTPHPPPPNVNHLPQSHFFKN